MRPVDVDDDLHGVAGAGLDACESMQGDRGVTDVVSWSDRVFVDHLDDKQLLALLTVAIGKNSSLCRWAISMGDSRSDAMEDLATEGEDAASAGVEAWPDTVADKRDAE
jgi:hypothetical protein